MRSYEHGSDFVAYFLQSPITKELEYEIRIKARNKSAATEYQKLLKKENIPYRQIGLEVFPLPICLLLDLSSLGRALDALATWYARNKEKGGIKISILKPSGDLAEIRDEQDIQNVMEAAAK